MLIRLDILRSGSDFQKERLMSGELKIPSMPGSQGGACNVDEAAARQKDFEEFLDKFGSFQDFLDKSGGRIKNPSLMLCIDYGKCIDPKSLEPPVKLNDDVPTS